MVHAELTMAAKQIGAFAVGTVVQMYLHAPQRISVYVAMHANNCKFEFPRVLVPPVLFGTPLIGFQTNLRIYR